MLNKKLVLIVEDDNSQALRLAGMLRAQGANVMAASTIQEAACQVMYFTFDLIILDMHLPDGSGYDLLRMVREAQIPTPVIAMSGAFDALMAVQDGGFDYKIEKPLVKADLLAIANRLCRVSVQN